MLKNRLVDGAELTDCGKTFMCEPCKKGKMTRKPFPKQSHTTSTSILNLIHSDLCGPMQTLTPSKKKYFLTFIDDFSRYTVVYLLSSKDQVLEKFQEYVNYVENKFGKKPSVIRSDRGGEYVGKEFKDYLSSKGIQHQMTAPYSPQQNGVAERKNRSLVEMTRCMLADANLPNKYWGEALMTANYVQNCLFTKSIEKIPSELWERKRVNIKHFKIFGSEVFMHIPDQKRQKLDQKALKLVFVGYETGSKTYRLLDTKTDKIYKSRDNEFLEYCHSNLLQNNENTKKDQFHEDNNETVIIFNDDKNLDNNINNLDDREEEEIDKNNFKDLNSQIEDRSKNEVPEERVQDIDEKAPLRRSTRKTKGIPPDRLGYFVKEKDDQRLNVLIQEPKTRQQALNSEDSAKWVEAMNEEMDSLKKNKTWDLVEMPENKNIVGCKWVFKIKIDENGKPSKYKARIVAQGFSQKFGKDYDEVFAPVIKQTTLRIFFALVGKYKMKTVHYDFKTAFLNGELDVTELYMKQPDGYEVTDNNKTIVCKLNKGLYGLKQAARIWNITINNELEKLGFRRGKFDQCIYWKMEKGKLIYLLIYVDDLLLSCEDDELINDVIRDLSKHFEIKSLGNVKYYLGILIEQDQNGKTSFCQKPYINKMLKNYGLEEAKPSKIPLDPGYYKKKKKCEEFTNKDIYQSAIGSLLYLSVNTRPDIAVATSILARNVSHPTKSDWTEVKRVMKYLIATSDFKIKFKMGDPKLSDNVLCGYSDADWANDKKNRKSNSGYVFFWNGVMIDWRSRKQDCVALSSTEAEFVALAETCQQALFIKGILEDLGEKVQDIKIFEDNQSCLRLLDCEKINDRTKHIDTKYNFVKDLKKKKIITFEYCQTDNMVADFLTKPLTHIKLRKAVEAIGIADAH